MLFAFIIRDNLFPFFFSYIASLGIVPNNPAQIRIAAVRQDNSFVAFGTIGGLKGRGLRHFFKVVSIGAVPSAHFWCVAEIGHTFLTGCPVALVFFFVMMGAQGKSSMVSGTTVSSVRKYYVIAFVVANPVAATGGFGKFFARVAA
ncbi:MAG: hypothetical protein AAB729_04640 [Patescibacteria group bacterium]